MTNIIGQRTERILAQAKLFLKHGEMWQHKLSKVKPKDLEYVELHMPDGTTMNYHVDIPRLLSSSKSACEQKTQVPVTPYGKNGLIQFHDITPEGRLMVTDPVTRFEKYIQQEIKRWLISTFGAQREEYDRSLPVDDIQHFAVDNWKNFKEGISMRDIQPGQAEQREEGFQEFRNQPPQTPEIFNDRLIKLAVTSVLEEMNLTTRASVEYKDWAGPFENKHSSVSYPFGYQDDTVISEHTDFEGQLKKWYGWTYGQLCVEIAKVTPIKDMIKFFVYMGYGRNQRGKGRPLIAVARLAAVIGNLMTSVETQLCKTRVPFCIGYNGRDILKQAMIAEAEWCNANDCNEENFDYHAYDRSISLQWLALAGAFWYEFAADNRSREVVYYRTILGMAGILIDGIADPLLRISEIMGRQFSGELETNKSENVMNAVGSTAGMLDQDPQWINEVARRAPYPRMFMGDDCKVAYRRKYFTDHDRYVKFMKEVCGWEVHPDKGEVGAFFLQNRLFRDEDGNYILSYPVPRVIKSCFFTEKTRGLGPAGWTLATWSKLANIAEYEKGLSFARDLILQFDEQKLMLNVPIKDIIKQVEEEDAKAKEENKRAKDTWEIINDGDPGKRQLNKTDSAYLSQLQKKIREAAA